MAYKYIEIKLHFMNAIIWLKHGNQIILRFPTILLLGMYLLFFS